MADGWFADVSDPDEMVAGAPWQPFIQTAGCIFPLPVRFETKETCDEFIRRDLLNKGMLDDH